MFCRKCGKQLVEGAAFCVGCGTAVETVLQPKPMEQEPVQEEVVIPAELEETPAQEAREATPGPLDEAPVEEALETPRKEIPEEPAADFAWDQPDPYGNPEPSVSSEPVKKSKKVRGNRPHVAVQILMQFLSLIVYLVLTAALLGTVLLADLRQLTSAGGLKKVIDSMISAPATAVKATAEYVPAPTAPYAQKDYGVVRTADLDLNVNEIPVEILAGGDSEDNMEALSDWLYEQLKKSNNGKLKFSQDDFRDFVAESTVSEYMSEKLAGFASDILNGTKETEITADELMDLLEENERIMQRTLNLELTNTDWEKIEDKVEQVVEKDDLNDTIRTAVNSALDEAVQDKVGMEWDQAQEWLRNLTSITVLVCAIVLCLLLVGLLLLLNYYHLAGGLTWTGCAAILAGVIVSVPVVLLKAWPQLITDMVPALEKVMGLINSLLGAVAPIHFGLLLGGVVVLVASIIWRVVARALDK